jgi:hypothetical protein
LIVMQHKEARVAEYRRLAEQASALAEGSALDNVREKHERAAERWTALANLDDQSSAVPSVVSGLL